MIDRWLYFLCVSANQDDVHKSVKYRIWASTTRGNHTLNRAYHEQKTRGGPLFLYFSVNGSGVCWAANWLWEQWVFGDVGGKRRYCTF